MAFDSGWEKNNENFKEGEVGYNQFENNTSCFSAKAGNILYYKIHYRSTEGTTSYWWSNSEDPDNLKIRGIGSYSKSLNNPVEMNTDGLFIRCIKD